MDLAEIVVQNNLNFTVQIFWQYIQCYQCLYKFGSRLAPNDTFAFNVSTRYGTQYGFVGPNHTAFDDSAYCRGAESFSENWKYLVPLNFADGGAFSCQAEAVQTAPDANIPVYVALAIFTALGIAWAIFSRYEEHVVATIRSKVAHYSRIEDEQQGGSKVSAGASGNKPSRLNSLDSFRGLTLCLMIFVNYGGGSYAYFNHIDWNGVTFADLVFPGFVFIMGVTMSLTLRRSLAKKQRTDAAVSASVNAQSSTTADADGASSQETTSEPQNQTKSSCTQHTTLWQRTLMLLRIMRRSATLFLLGFSISNSGRSPDQWRVLGVLQRLGLTYLIVAGLTLVQLDAYPSALDAAQAGSFRLAWARDLYPFWLEWLIMAAIVAVYLSITFALPVPGCPTGYIGPGGLADEAAYANCTGGAAAYVDRTIFGIAHVYQFPTCKTLYDTTVPHDPEGLMGTLTSALLCYLGLQIGKIMFTYRNNRLAMYSRWLGWAILTGAVALGLCGAEMNGGVIPLNKNLWSFSYVLAMASVSTLVFGLFYVLIDHLQVWHGQPFNFIGQNSILIYCAHEVLEPYFPVTFGLDLETHAAALAMNLYSVIFWIFVSYVLYRKRLFLTI